MLQNIVRDNSNIDVKNRIEIHTQSQTRSWKRRKKCNFHEKIVGNSFINSRRCKEILIQQNGVLSLFTSSNSTLQDHRKRNHRLSNLQSATATSFYCHFTIMITLFQSIVIRLFSNIISMIMSILLLHKQVDDGQNCYKKDTKMLKQNKHFLPILFSENLMSLCSFSTKKIFSGFILLSTLATFSHALKNEFLPIKVLCQGHQGVPKPIDGAVVESKNERDVNCAVTFRTESILEKFMLRFSHLNIDCNDKLLIYDGEHTYGSLKANISCSKTPASVGDNGIIFTLTNFVTLKYVTDSWGTGENGFKMVITAFKDAKEYGCRDGFTCLESGRESCIHKDLVCDTISHCSSGGDERSSAFCDRLDVLSWLELDEGTATAIGLAIGLLIIAGLVALWLRSCRMHQNRTSQAAAGGSNNSGQPGFRMQVPLRKPNINGRGIPPVPDDQTRFTGIGRNTNAIGSINSYPQHPHLMTTMTRTNGAEGFKTTTKSEANLDHSSENETRPAVGRGYLTNFFIPKNLSKDHQEAISTALNGQVTHQQQLASNISHQIQHLYLLLL